MHLPLACRADSPGPRELCWSRAAPACRGLVGADLWADAPHPALGPTHLGSNTPAAPGPLQPSNAARTAAGARHPPEVFFYFYIFQNHFLHKYIFGFIIYRFIPLPPGCRAAGLPAALLPGDRDLNINKIYF